VLSYFGLRTIALGDGPKGKRPFLNGEFTFFAGFLDQSFFPDGLYTAPTDDALAYDIQAVPMFGMNMIRLHQKVNPERWYYHADKIGVAIFQDMVYDLRLFFSAGLRTKKIISHSRDAIGSHGCSFEANIRLTKQCASRGSTVLPVN